MSFTAVIGKEVGDVVREKRFGGWALAFAAFWAVVLVVFIVEMKRSLRYNGGYPWSVFELVPVLYYAGAISLVVLALFTVTDGIAKDRESGILPVVGATPAERWQLPFAKLVAGVVTYGAAVVVALLPMCVFAYAQGTPILVLSTIVYLGPFLVLWLFLLGLGLLLGVAAKSSKVAIGAGAAIYFPLFLLGAESPFNGLYSQYPVLKTIATYTPFDAAYRGTLAVAYGGAIPWGPLAVTAGLGAALAAGAFVLFARQEVAA